MLEFEWKVEKSDSDYESRSSEKDSKFEACECEPEWKVEKKDVTIKSKKRCWLLQRQIGCAWQ